MASLENDVARTLRCPICTEFMAEHIKLSCAHTFCKTCLTSLLTLKAGTNSISCPVCSVATNVEDGDFSDLTTNSLVSSPKTEVEDKGQQCEVCDIKSEAVVYCCDCQHYMCGPCHEQHIKLEPYGNHKVVSVSDIREGKVSLKTKVFCKDHLSGEQHECTNVCINCKKLICSGCRVSDHEKKGHTVQSYQEYNASSAKEVDSLLKEAENKTDTIDKFITVLEAKGEEDLKHIEWVKADADIVYLDVLKALDVKKALIDKKCDAEMDSVVKKYDNMKFVGENQRASIKSACNLAAKSSKSPIEGDIVAIRDSLCAGLKLVLSQKDPDNYRVYETSEFVKSFKFDRDVENEIALGKVYYTKWTLKVVVVLPTKNAMSCMVPVPTGEMAVGCDNGTIEIFSSEGILQKRIHVGGLCRTIAFMGNGCHLAVNSDNKVVMYTPDWKRHTSRFKTLNHKEGGYSYVSVDAQDNIYLSYRKAKVIQMFTPEGGDAVKEIPCKDYGPSFIHAMRSKGELLVSDNATVRVINEQGAVKHSLDREGERLACCAVCRDGSVIVAWVSFTDFLVTIKRYTNELVYRDFDIWV